MSVSGRKKNWPRVIGFVNSAELSSFELPTDPAECVRDKCPGLIVLSYALGGSADGTPLILLR